MKTYTSIQEAAAELRAAIEQGNYNRTEAGAARLARVMAGCHYHMTPEEQRYLRLSPVTLLAVAVEMLEGGKDD